MGNRGGYSKIPPLGRKTLDPPSPERGKKAKGPPFEFFRAAEGGTGTGLNFTELTGFKLDLAVIKRN